MTKISHPGFVALSIFLMVGMLFASEVCAHKVRVFAYVQGDTLVVEGYFSKSVKARNCLVQVYDSGDHKIAEARTDENGIASFKLSKMTARNGDLKVVLEAGHGHKALFTVAETELPNATRSRQMEKATVSKRVDPKPSPSVSSDRSKESGAKNASREAQAALISEVLDRKLEPIVKMLGNQQRLLLAHQDRGPNFRDVIGGIGWILGIVGVAAYFLSRKPVNRK